MLHGCPNTCLLSINNRNKEREVGIVEVIMCTNCKWSDFEAFMNVTGATGRYIWSDSGCSTGEDCVCCGQCRFSSECDNPSDRNDSASGETHRCHEDCYTTSNTTVGNSAAVVAAKETATTKDDTAYSGTVQELDQQAVF